MKNKTPHTAAVEIEAMFRKNISDNFEINADAIRENPGEMLSMALEKCGNMIPKENDDLAKLTVKRFEAFAGEKLDDIFASNDKAAFLEICNALEALLQSVRTKKIIQH